MARKLAKPTNEPDILTDDDGAINSFINGKGGDDTITGKGGRDTLTGGAGADTFVYLAAGDSAAASGAFNRKTGDTIRDFKTGTDKIDLTAFGPALSFSGATSGNNKVWFDVSKVNGKTVTDVFVATDNDGVADMAIRLSGKKALTAGDFIFAPAPAKPVISSAATASFAENGTGTAYEAKADLAATWTLEGDDAALFSISADGKVTFKAAPDFEKPADKGANNVYDIIVKATTTQGSVAMQAVAITVTDVNETVPVIDTTPPAAPTALDLADADVTAADKASNLTKNTSGLTISGKGEAGASVLLFDDKDGDNTLDAGEKLGEALVNPDGNFSTDVSLSAGTHSIKAIQTDMAGNASPVSASPLVIKVDTKGPAIQSISAPNQSSLSDGETVTIYITYDDDVIINVANGAPELDLGQGMKALYDADKSTGKVLAFTFTASADFDGKTPALTEGSLAWDTGTVTDAAGNDAQTSLQGKNPPPLGIIDALTVSISSLEVNKAQDIGLGSILIFTLTFSESVFVDSAGGVPKLDLGGSRFATYVAPKAGDAPNQMRFSYTVVAGDNLFDPDIGSGAVQANGAVFSSGPGRTVDTSLGGVTIPPIAAFDTIGPKLLANGIAVSNTTPEVGLDDEVTITLTFSEAIALDLAKGSPELVLSDGRKAGFFSQDDTHLVFKYNPGSGDNGNLAIENLDLKGSVLTDKAGNLFDSVSFENANKPALPLVDTTALKLESVNVYDGNLIEVGSKVFKEGAELRFRLFFDDYLSAADFSGITLTLSNGATATFDQAISVGTGIKTLQFIYTVGPDDVESAELSVQSINIPDNVVLTDNVGNGFLASSLSTATIVSEPQIDTKPPVITGITASDTALNLGETLYLYVATEEQVIVSGGVPFIKLTADGSKTAVYDSIASTDTMIAFKYVVQAGDGFTPVIGSSIELAGATIRDLAGHDLPTSLAQVPGKPQFSTVDTSITAVSSISVNDPNLAAGETAIISVVFNGPLTQAQGGQGVPTLDLGGGRFATYEPAHSNLTNGVLSFSYQVNSANDNGWKPEIGTIDLKGSTLNGSGGIAANVDLSAISKPQFGFVDTVAPVLSQVAYLTPAEQLHDGTFKAGETMLIRLDFNQSLANSVDPGNATLNLSNGKTATYFGSSGNSQLFTYTVASGDDTAALKVDQLNLNGAIFRDLAGNKVTVNWANVTQSNSPVIDTVAPKVISVSIPNTSPLAANEALIIEVTFDSPIAPIDTQSGVPFINLGNGLKAVFLSQAGSKLSFRYVATQDDHGKIPAIGALNANGAVITDLAGNTAQLAYQAGYVPPTLAAIDTVAPTDPELHVIADRTLLQPEISETSVVSGPVEPVLWGFAEAGATLQVKILSAVAGAYYNNGGAGRTAMVTVDSSGRWSFDPVATFGLALTPAGYQIFLTATDAAGNVNPGASTSAFSFTVLAAGSATGGSENDYLRGGNGTDTLQGTNGDDVLFGGLGNMADTLSGGGGVNDTASYFGISGGVTVDLTKQGAPQDTINAGMDSLAGIENLVGTNSADMLTGDPKNNIIEGAGGDDTLDGGGGTDTVSYMLATSSVSVSLALAKQGTQVNTVGAGKDTLFNFENILGSKFSDTLIGDDGSNTIEGGDGNDFIDGGTGGSDTASYSRARSAVTVDLTKQNTNQDTKGAGSDKLVNIANLIGSAFADTLIGDTNGNTLTGGEGNDQLTGGVGMDSLSGDAGDDIMAGGLDNDNYIVLDAGDQVIELQGEGIDTIGSYLTWTLSGNKGDNVENLWLGGGSNLDATGNALDNALTGNSGNNKLYGLGGKDTLIGGVGNDELYGGIGDDTLQGDSGNDILDGGAGADQMTGGVGDDTYYVDSQSDVIVETAGQGVDTVVIGATDVSPYTMPAEVEKLWMSGFLNLNVYGNALDNIIFGNGGNNFIDGGSGNDTIDGGAGDDKNFGNAGNDTVSYASATGPVTVMLGDTQAQNTGGAGLDTLNGIENLIGSDYNDILYGKGDANVIDGGKGLDQLTGGAGADTFQFSNADVDTTLGKVTDMVMDSVVAGDKLRFVGGGAGSATNYFETAVIFGSLTKLLEDADLKLNGTIRYYVGDFGNDAYVVYDLDGFGYTDVVKLVGRTVLSITEGDFIA